MRDFVNLEYGDQSSLAGGATGEEEGGGGEEGVEFGGIVEAVGGEEEVRPLVAQGGRGGGEVAPGEAEHATGGAVGGAVARQVIEDGGLV